MKIHSLIPVVTLACVCALSANAATTSHQKKPMKKQPAPIKVADKPRTDPAPTPAAAEPVGVSLSINHSSYTVSASDETPAMIHATLTVYNHTNQPVQFTLKGFGCKWQILDAQKNLVWDSLFGKMLPHMVRLRTLTNEEMTFKSEIKLQKQDGTALAPGQYILHAELLGSPVYTGETAFTVK